MPIDRLSNTNSVREGGEDHRSNVRFIAFVLSSPVLSKMASEDHRSNVRFIAL
ncbi:MAG: hypothetical protein M1456_07470 [Actinobacteria bacterium]|nr:hypothetical protein [Actinomycetota bacterium]